MRSRPTKVYVSCSTIFVSSIVWKAVGCSLSSKNGFPPSALVCVDSVVCTFFFGCGIIYNADTCGPLGMLWFCHVFQIKQGIPCDEVKPCISSIKSTRHVQLLACCMSYPCWKYKVCCVQSNVSILCLLHSVLAYANRYNLLQKSQIMRNYIDPMQALKSPPPMGMPPASTQACTSRFSTSYIYSNSPSASQAVRK